jgi:hypothetical protein
MRVALHPDAESDIEEAAAFSRARGFGCPGGKVRFRVHEALGAAHRTARNWITSLSGPARLSHGHLSLHSDLSCQHGRDQELGRLRLKPVSILRRKSPARTLRNSLCHSRGGAPRRRHARAGLPPCQCSRPASAGTQRRCSPPRSLASSRSNLKSAGSRPRNFLSRPSRLCAPGLLSISKAWAPST